MTEQTTWGILGTGRMAKVITAELLDLDGAEVLAVGSRDQKNADAFGETYSIAQRYGSYEEFSQDPNIDIVYVATPHFRHVEDVRLCLEAGKHVLCERPFSLRPEDVEPLIALAREKNLFLMEGMWTRFTPGIRKLCDLIDRKAVGEIKMIIGGGGFIPTDESASHIYDPDHGGGVLLDSGIDLISLTTMIFGKPTTVNGIATLSEEGVDEQNAILLGYSHGRIANLYVTIKAVQSPYMTLLGTEGSIEVIPPVYAPQFLIVQNQEGKQTIHNSPLEGSGYRYELEEVMTCLRENRRESSIMSLDETLRLLNIANEIRLQTGVRFPFE